MLSLRLQRVRVELSSHRQWLTSFVDGNYHKTRSSFNVPISSTSFPTTGSHGVRNRRHAKARPMVGNNARRAGQNRARQPIESQGTVQQSALAARDDLLQAIQLADIKTAIALYDRLPAKKPLTPDDFRAIAQCTHQCLRVENQKPAEGRNRQDKEELVNFTIRLVDDLRHGNLLPSIQAHIHLLAIFREAGTGDAGIKFWQWLQEQDEDYVNASAYGAAIDLLAVNGTPLNELEELYHNALARFPGNFHAYHLSPDAILPDREQPVMISQLPLALLRSIMRARLLQGKARNAYLALDTVFRLFPTSVPPRFLAAFNDERPVSESYTVFAMACRSGIQLPASHYKGLISKLRTSTDMTSLAGRTATLRAMLAATYLYLTTSGSVPENAANEVIIATTQILRLPGVSSLDSKQRRRVVDTVLDAVRKMMEIFVKYGTLPATSIFNSIITNIAGYGRAKETIGIALADMDALSLKPTEVTRRSIMGAAGLLGDGVLVVKTWRDIVAARAQENRPFHGLDFHVFIKAARLTGDVDFAKSEWVKHKEKVQFKHRRKIAEAFEKPLDESDSASDGTAVSSEQIRDSRESLVADLAYIEEKTRGSPVVQDFSDQNLPMTFFEPEKSLRIPEREMRKIYDEMTTERNTSPAGALPDANPTGQQKAAAITDTGFSFGNLRYENWKTMNYLLQLADKHDEDYDAAVDKAIASGVRPPERNMGISKEEIEGMKSFGLSATGASTRKATSQDVEEAKKTISRLRSLT